MEDDDYNATFLMALSSPSPLMSPVKIIEREIFDRIFFASRKISIGTAKRFSGLLEPVSGCAGAHR